MYDLVKFLPGDYRVDFDSVKWEESIVVFGCSMAYGEALAIEDTIPHHLSKMLNVPVINMGVIGAAMDFSLYNQLVLHKNYPTPKAVISLWTEHSRTSYFKESGIVGYGPWNSPKGSYGDLWTEDPQHSKTHALMIQAISRTLWKEIPYYEATFFRSTQAVLNCDQLVGHMTETDYAADGVHPGPIATKVCSEYIVSRFNFS